MLPPAPAFTSVHRLLVCVFGVQTSVVITALFQERLFSFGYESIGGGRRAEVFSDQHFVVVAIRSFVLIAILFHRLAKFVFLSFPVHLRLQMMVAMNAMNLLSSWAALQQEGDWRASLAFARSHPAFAVDLFVLCAAELVGQVFIFMTIQHFGFLRFGAGMIARQLAAGALAFAGITSVHHFSFVFGSLLLVASVWSTRKRVELRAIKER
ncbi:hypothetical protein M3Y99_01085100 [Aphelenchoides fujianensis]|nr:hypothetical protein M3Y99_01085100 [Aphelenchoides fujianensis]